MQDGKLQLSFHSQLDLAITNVRLVGTLIIIPVYNAEKAIIFWELNVTIFVP